MFAIVNCAPEAFTFTALANASLKINVKKTHLYLDPIFPEPQNTVVPAVSPVMWQIYLFLII